MFAGEPEAALEAAESELQIAERFQLPLISRPGRIPDRMGAIPAEERAIGLQRMEEAISAIRRTGAEMGLPYLIGLYADALADSGRFDDAEKSIEAALDLGRYNGTYFQLAELLTIEARIRESSGGGSHEIEWMLHKAENIAALQRSAIGRLRVAVELARRFQKRGDAQRAHELVMPHAELVGRLGDSADARAARDFF